MKTLSVAEYLELVNETLSLIPTTEFLVEGEVAEYRVSQQKWIHFLLKDEKKEACVPCFATTYQLSVPLEDGMRVQVAGYARIFERFGKFSLNVRQVTPVGEGALRKAYELLKKKLEEEGLFDVGRKREPPRFPRTVGLLTSPEAAAYTDFVRIAKNRWAGSVIELYPVHVQGARAVENILEAFAYFQTLSVKERPDILVLTRGGGSFEDLHAFNDERVARAVFGSPVAVVVGVGHERDESLCDFVADVRASTPSNAAEMVFPDRRAVAAEIESSVRVWDSRLHRWVEERHVVLARAGSATTVFFEQLSSRLLHNTKRLGHVFWPVMARARERVEHLERILKQSSPKRILARGYSIVRLHGGVLKDARALVKGEAVQVQLAHGSFDAEVTSL
ncbi:exodeoxyribonuclease VII large subunit [Candidatus Uhrbacteria bacterium]|nr:exodeoxyribonuclease VII large subunit [Candidatus Uhrbacteria bacterium]